MAARPVWQGFIRFSLVSIPAKGFATTASGEGGGQIHLNQLHKGCGARVKYEKVCPVHGKLSADEIESGYEFAKDQYVTVDADALATLRRGSDKTIGIEAFIPRDCVAPRFFSGRTMYLLPDGPIGGKPYAMLHQLMNEQKRNAFCTAVMNGREQLMLMRPIEQLIGLEFLRYQAEVKAPSELAPELHVPAIAKKELDLARTLFEQLTEDGFELGAWKNHYASDLRKLIDAKVAGQEVVTPPAEEEPQVINLMEALQRSLADAKSKSSRPAGEASKRPPRRAPRGRRMAGAATGKAPRAGKMVIEPQGTRRKTA